MWADDLRESALPRKRRSAVKMRSVALGHNLTHALHKFEKKNRLTRVVSRLFAN